MNEDGKYVCPEGYEFEYVKTTIDTKGKYPRENITYECKYCSTCTVKNECTKSQTNRKLVHSPKLKTYEAKAKENLDSSLGIALKTQRSAQVEGAFGVIKQDMNYQRISRRSLKKVKTEVMLVCIGYNLRKYHKKKYRLPKELMH